MKAKSTGKARRGGGTYRHAGPDRRLIYLICIILTAILIISVASVLRSASDKRKYTDYMQQAQQSYYSNDFDSALAALRKAAAIEKTDDCLMLMASCYETQGNYVKALEVLRMMDTRDPVIAARISSIETRRKTLSESEKVTIAGRQYPANTTSLVLDNMGLTDSVLDEILQLYSLESLSVAGNYLQNVSRLGELGGLVTLNLGKNNIQDISVLSGLPKLRTLYLDSNPIIDLTPLTYMPNLTSLSIKGIGITDKQLATLSKALPNCAIHSEEAEEEIQDISFGGMTFKSDVTELNLSGMGIWDISALAGCSELVKLNLSGNYITDLTPLMNIPNLKWLDISDNQVSDIKPLMGMSALRSLNAANNNISNTSSLTVMTKLTELNLDGNPIRDFSGFRKLRGLNYLSLNATGMTDESLQYFANLANLTYLGIEDNEALTGASVDMLKKALTGCEVRTSQLSYLVPFAGVMIDSATTQMTLNGMNIDDISGIMNLGSLETVQMSRNNIVNLYPFDYSPSVNTLKFLDLSANSIADATPLARLSVIEYLDLSYNYISSELPLLNLTSLRVLNLVGNPLTEEQVETIRNCLIDCIVYF